MTDRQLYFKVYYKKNKNQIINRVLSNYHNDKEKARERDKSWQQRNKDKKRAIDDRSYLNRKEKALIKFIKKREIERKYRSRRKELYQKRKAEGYYKSPEYKAKMSAYYRTEEYRKRERHKKQKMKANAKAAIEGAQRRV